MTQKANSGMILHRYCKGLSRTYADRKSLSLNCLSFPMHRLHRLHRYMVVCLGEKGAEMKKRVFYMEKRIEDLCDQRYQCESSGHPLVISIGIRTGQCLHHCITCAFNFNHHGGKGIYLLQVSTG